MTYTVNESTFKTAIANGENDTKAKALIPGGATTGYMYIGMSYTRPVADATKVIVTGYGDGDITVDLTSVEAESGLSGWNNDSMLMYLPFAKNVDLDADKGEMYTDGSYTFTLTWTNASNEVVAITVPTVNRVVTPAE